MTIFLLTLVNILNYLDRILVQAVKPLLIKEWHLSEQDAGYLIAAVVLGYCLFAPIFGKLGTRYRRPTLMAVGIVLWSGATIFTALAPTFSLFFLARMSVGVGEASFATITPAYLNDRIKDPTRLNWALAIFSAAIPVGSALGFVLGGYAAAHFSWHAAFYLGGVPGLLLAYFVWRLPETEDRVHTGHGTPLLQSWKTLARIPVLMIAIGGYVFNSFALAGIAAMIIGYGTTIGFGLEEINSYFGIILVAAGFIGSLGGGRLSTNLARRSQNPRRSLLFFTGISALLGVPFLVTALITQTQSLFLILCFLAELMIFAGVAPINSVIVLSAPRPLVTAAQGLTIASINILGSFLAPIVLGAVADRTTLPFALQLCSIALFMSGSLWCIGAALIKGREEVDLREISVASH